MVCLLPKPTPMKRFKRACGLALVLIPIVAAPARALVDFMDIEAVSMAIEAIHLEGQEQYDLAPGTDGRLTAKTYPVNLRDQVRWSIVEEHGNLVVDLDAETGRLAAAQTSGTGWIRVQAAVEGCAPRTRRIDIDCPCGEQAGPCYAPAGAGKVANGSVDVRLSLGRGDQGRSAGDLFLYADAPLAVLATPEALVIESAGGDIEPLHRGGQLVQILAPRVLVNILRFSPLEYEIHFYDIAFRGRPSEDGLYSLDPRAVPTVVWRIENPDTTGETHTQLAITEIRGGDPREFLYSYDAAEHGWTLVSGNGLKIESKSETTNPEGDRVVRRTVAGPDGDPVRVEETVYRTFAFGERPIRKIVDPEGAALTTRYRYGTGPGPGYGRPTARLDPSGGWVRYGYDDQGRVVREVRPFRDAPFDAPGDAAVVVTTGYAPVDPSDSGVREDRRRPRQVIETTMGIETGRTYHAYRREADGGRTEITERCTRQGRPYGDPTNLRSVTRYYGTSAGEPRAGRIQSRLSADGRRVAYTYEQGRFMRSPDPAQCRFVPGDGKAVRTTVTHGTADHPAGIPFKTTRETTIRDALGRAVLQERSVRTEEGFARVDWQLDTHDRRGRVIETLQANGTRTETRWGCCGKTSETNAEGLTVRFVYDDLKRLVTRIEAATGVVTEYTYDAAGRRLSATRANEGLRLTQTNHYDGAGRLTARVDPAGLVTRYAYEGQIVTTVSPGGATEVTTRHLDGRLASVTGTAVVPRYYRYGVNPDGTRWTQVILGRADSPRWEKTTRDLAGRIVRVEKPGFGGLEVTQYRYDGKGRLVRIASPGRAATLYNYDALGNRTTTGLDVDGDGRLRPASMDRIVAAETAFALIDGAWWREKRRALLADGNSAEETTVSVRRQRLTVWKKGVVAEQVAVDIHGNATRTVVTLDRFERTRIRTVHAPDAATPSRTVYVNGRLAAVTGKSGVTRTFGYDALGRRIAVEDPRKGLSRLLYDGGGRLVGVEDAAGRHTRFSYDPDSGRRIAATNALGKVTYYAYNDRGQLVRTWGQVPYPATYRYDPYGRMVEMRTFRGGTGWDGPSWPESSGPGDPTRWHFQEATGLLAAKEDAAGNRTTYTYGPGGAPATRTWARHRNGNPLVTAYRYDPATGDLLKIDYGDDTPDIAFAYDRLGRKVRVNDAAGVRHFVYNAALQLENEELAGQQIYGIERSYDQVGRIAGLELDGDYGASYGYDAHGRFKTVDWRMGEQSGGARYRYLAQSDLLAGMESHNGLAVRYAYAPHRDVKTSVSNNLEERLISRYIYQYDPLGRRINVKTDGEAFQAPGFRLYGYNDRNEVTAAGRFHGDDLSDQTQPLPHWERAYRYDPIGNRIAAVEGAEKLLYRANALNQYEKISSSTQGEETLFYDADGNLVEDGRFEYIWNAENRLTAVEPKVAKRGAKRLTFAYDYLGRRFIKKVFVFDGQAYRPFETIHFVYDGWNMIKETGAKEDDIVDRFYVWGLDLSLSLQGAGGVGGLLATSDGSSTYAYLFDGNGNVGQVLNSSDGDVSGDYEYDPFGKPAGLKADYRLDRGYQFSSKPFHSEIELSYFGYRFYSSKVGRWLSRDPYESYNLYGFVHNNAIDKIDILGLYDYQVSFDDITEYLSTHHDVPPEMALSKYQAFPAATREWINDEIRKQKGTPKITDVFVSTDFEDELTPYVSIPQNGREAVFPQKGFWMCKEELIGDKILGPLHHRFIVEDGIGHGYEKATHFLWSNPGAMRVENELRPRTDVRCYELKCLLPECASELLDLFISKADSTLYNLGYRDCQSWANAFAESAYENCEDKCCEEKKPNRPFFKRTGW